MVCAGALTEDEKKEKEVSSSIDLSCGSTERLLVLDAFLSSKRFSRGTCSDVKVGEQKRNRSSESE